MPQRGRSWESQVRAPAGSSAYVISIFTARACIKVVHNAPIDHARSIYTPAFTSGYHGPLFSTQYHAICCWVSNACW